MKGDDDECIRGRKLAAETILRRHLRTGAQEPVNVDSHARQAAQDGPTTPHQFATAQKQIYNLMKFDSFTRFLKSDLYKDSLVAEMSGKGLPFENAENEPLLDIGESCISTSSTHSSLGIYYALFGEDKSLCPSRISKSLWKQAKLCTVG